MPASKAAPKSLVEAVQEVFEALEPFDEAARQRIISSVVSLLGSSIPATGQHIIDLGQSRPSVVTLPRAPGGDRPLSPIELLQQKKPATNAQRLALFAYYREKIEGISRFAKDDLRSYFAKAKQSPPQNFDRDYGQAVKLGWIYDDGADSYLTSKGLELVEAGFEGRALPRGAAASKAGGKKKKRPKK
jgi:hypothetical protein